MVRTGAFNYINVLQTGLDASWTRNSVIANNIANADTPGYKRKDVQFEDYLMNEIGFTDSLDDEVAGADLDALTATTYTEYDDPILESSRSGGQDGWAGTGSVVKVKDFFETSSSKSPAWSAAARTPLAPLP